MDRLIAIALSGGIDSLVAAYLLKEQGHNVIGIHAVLSFVRKLGATTLATVHYARITKNSKNKFHLFKVVDPKKDQSYFLAFITQQHLSSACFPLESLTKSEVLKLANEKGLDPFIKKESNDVCFIRNKTYGKFLALQEG
ncbi:MAG: hypothetical protein V3S72_00040, partial [Desulfobacterales bacterium]